MLDLVERVLILRGRSVVVPASSLKVTLGWRCSQLCLGPARRAADRSPGRRSRCRRRPPLDDVGSRAAAELIVGAAANKQVLPVRTRRLYGEPGRVP